jgi:hypothetical protein
VRSNAPWLYSLAPQSEIRLTGRSDPQYPYCGFNFATYRSLMPRPNFSMNQSGPIFRSIHGSEVSGHVGDWIHVEESYEGTRRRKPSGFLKPTNYKFRRVRYDRGLGSTSYTLTRRSDGVKVQSDRFSGVVGGGISPAAFNVLNNFDDCFILPEVAPAWMRDQALIEARLSMKDKAPQLGQAFAERNQTARLLGDTATRLAKAYRALRRRRFRDCLDQLGISSHKFRKGSPVNQWLELQYGWKPLLGDVYDATEALAKRPSSDWRVTGKGSSLQKISVTKEVSPGTGGGLARAEGMIGYFVRIDAVPENDLLLAFSSMGLTNPLNLAWELLPFSFVIDWALPIGDYLSSLDAMLGYSNCTASESSITRCKWDVNGLDYRLETSDWLDEWKNDYHATKSEVNLSRLSFNEGVPLPTLPRLKDPVSLGHMANGLSLLASVFGSR